MGKERRSETISYKGHHSFCQNDPSIGTLGDADEGRMIGFHAFYGPILSIDRSYSQ